MTMVEWTYRADDILAAEEFRAWGRDVPGNGGWTSCIDTFGDGGGADDAGRGDEGEGEELHVGWLRVGDRSCDGGLRIAVMGICRCVWYGFKRDVEWLEVRADEVKRAVGA